MKALFWDFDGTLVDTRQKNYNVIRKIIAENTARQPDDFPVLKSADHYSREIEKCVNWRHIYREHFGLDSEQIDRVGKLWTSYQRMDNTRTPVFKGIRDVLNSLDFVPHVIISQNSSENIYKILSEHQIEDFFKLIIGYEEVDISRQKPEPDGILKAIEILGFGKLDIIFYIGDHVTDVRCSINANQVIKKQQWPVHILSIGVKYSHAENNSIWQVEPDYYAEKPSDIFEIVTASG
jgi:HAD superfamily hydrolase (TIGR01549 family)